MSHRSERPYDEIDDRPRPIEDLPPLPESLYDPMPPPPEF
jgi:hypothetical protein